MSGADRSRRTPQIIVDQPVALYDTPVAIAVEGFAPEDRITVSATLRIPGSVPWRSHATFVADSSGRVDVTSQAPVDGTYDGIAPMGLFWSCAPVAHEQPAPPDTVMQPQIVRLEAAASGGARVELRLERRLASPGVTRRVVREEGVVGALFLPTGPGPHPTVIVLGGSDGNISEHRSALLASHGYAALSLAYFRHGGLPRGMLNIPLEYFENAIHWMRAQAWLEDHFLAVWGSSRGGELALLLGSMIPDINAVVAHVPSGVLHGGFGAEEASESGPCAAWTYRGRALPYLQENNTADDPTVIDYEKPPIAEAPRYLALLRDRNAVEQATIPVEKIRGPILLVSGQDDQIWPSPVLAEIAIRRLQEHAHAFPFEHLSYEGAGHGIYIPYNATTQITFVHPVDGLQYTGGGTPRRNAEAGTNAWRRVLAFLEESRGCRA
jgi:dienelactone hydrolase